MNALNPLVRHGALVPVLLACIAGIGCGGNSFSDVLKGYGYTELRPPSTLYPPGTIVFVREKAPFQAGIVCTQKASLGEGLMPPESATASSKISNEFKKSLTLDAKYLERIKASGGYESVESIDVNVTNARVFALSDDLVRANIDKRSTACRDAVRARIEGNYDVSMISSILQADVEYSVAFKTSANLTASQQGAITQGLATSLGMSASSAGQSSIKGTGLYWGVIDDTFLIGVKSSTAAVSASGSTYKHAHEHVKLLPMQLLGDKPVIDAE